MESATQPETTAQLTEERPANGKPEAAESFDVHRPVDGSVIQTVAIDSPQSVAETAARLRAAQPAWEAIGFAGRRRWLESLRDWILDNQDRLDDLMQQETGKVRADAALEAFYCLEAINFWVDQGPKFLADETISPHNPLLKSKRAKIVYRPFGVVGFISPWNFPVILSLGDALPALMAGNAALIKPSELTPLTLMEMVRGWREDVGAPDVLAVVNGMGETGGALVDESDYVQFTGSERTGRIVMKRAADTLTPVSLELGGKDPLIVTRDADIDRAVNATAWGGLLNTGQICISIERVYVEEPIYDEFVDKLRAQVETLRQGADGDTYTRRGRGDDLARADRHRLRPGRGRARRRRPDPHRRQAQGRAGRLVRADGDRRRRPLDEGDARGDLRPGDPGDEGPRRRRRRSSSPTTPRYGLGSSVFAGDPAEGERIARRVEAGSCNVNDVLVNYNVLGLPMGGWKNSGIGVRHGAQGIRRFCHTEALTIPRLPTAKSEPVWFPYSARKRGVVRRLYTLLNARGLRNRLGLRRRS